MTARVLPLRGQLTAGLEPPRKPKSSTALPSDADGNRTVTARSSDADASPHDRSSSLRSATNRNAEPGDHEPMSIRIKSWHGHAVTFPILVERVDPHRGRVSEEVGVYTIDPGERGYDAVPTNVLEAIRTHHEPGGMMRIDGPAAAVPASTVEVGGGESAKGA
jgi:hypothetical protein